MQIPVKLQAPIVLPPETVSNTYVSKSSFNLEHNLSVMFKINSQNTQDKELIFSMFLSNSDSTSKFGASTIRGGCLDYSSKGEVLCRPLNTKEFTYNNEQIDLVLDHVSQNSDISLVNNELPVEQNNLISLIFDGNKVMTSEYKDAYNNLYFSKLSLRDIITEELITDFSNISNLVILQILDKFYAIDFIVENESIDIKNVQDVCIRLSVENSGKIIKVDIRKPNTSDFVNFITKISNINLSQFSKIKIGYGIGSPTISYDKLKIADFNISDFHIKGRLI